MIYDMLGRLASKLGILEGGWQLGCAWLMVKSSGEAAGCAGMRCA